MDVVTCVEITPSFARFEVLSTSTVFTMVRDSLGDLELEEGREYLMTLAVNTQFAYTRKPPVAAPEA